MARLSRFYKNVGLSTVSLLFTLVLIETGLRIFYHYHPRDFEKPVNRSPTPDYSFEMVSNDGTTIAGPGWVKLVFHPYLNYKTAPGQHNALFNINSLGFRGEEISQEKEEAVFRIIVLGGSAAFGTGSSSDAGTLTYQLQRKLNEDSSFPKRIEVINAGVIGYVSNQEALYLETELIDLKPDLIIVYDGNNDFFTTGYMTQGCRDPVEKPEQIGYHMFFYEVEAQLIDHAQERNVRLLSRTSAVLKLLVLKTALGKFLRERFWALQALPPTSRTESQNWTDYELDASCVQYLINNYRRNLERMARVLGCYNASLLIAVQPEMEWKAPWSKEEIQAEQDLSKRYPWYRRAMRVIYPQLLQAAANLAAEQSAAFVDLRAVFKDRSETIFIDWVHTNDRGNEIVAQALSDYWRAKKTHP